MARECVFCEGRGWAVCLHCQGTGMMPCWNCGGPGADRCRVCKGTRYIECPDCNGVGCDLYGEECHRCGGRGQTWCRYCHSRSEPLGECAECSDLGFLACSECQGRIHFFCPHCLAGWQRRRLGRGAAVGRGRKQRAPGSRPTDDEEDDFTEEKETFFLREFLEDEDHGARDEDLGDKGLDTEEHDDEERVEDWDGEEDQDWDEDWDEDSDEEEDWDEDWQHNEGCWEDDELDEDAFADAHFKEDERECEDEADEERYEWFKSREDDDDGSQEESSAGLWRILQRGVQDVSAELSREEDTGSVAADHKMPHHREQPGKPPSPAATHLSVPPPQLAYEDGQLWLAPLEVPLSDLPELIDGCPPGVGEPALASEKSGEASRLEASETAVTGSLRDRDATVGLPTRQRPAIEESGGKSCVEEEEPCYTERDGTDK